MDETTLERISNALDAIATGIAELSLAIRGAQAATTRDLIEAYAQASETVGHLVDDLPDLPFADDEPPARRRAAVPKPSATDRTRCPLHEKQWRRGRFGAYCPSRSDDRDWSNDNGYCTITPENALDYLASVR